MRTLKYFKLFSEINSAIIVFLKDNYFVLSCITMHFKIHFKIIIFKLFFFKLTITNQTNLFRINFPPS